MMFAQQLNRLMTHFSERIPVVKRHISVLRFKGICCLLLFKVEVAGSF